MRKSSCFGDMVSVTCCGSWQEGASAVSYSADEAGVLEAAAVVVGNGIFGVADERMIVEECTKDERAEEVA